MPRITSISGRSLANTATKRSITYYPFTGPNISGLATATQLGGGTRTQIISAWSFNNGNVALVATGLPYHSYGNSLAVNTAAAQNFNLSWTYRGGSNIEGSATETVGGETGGGIIGIWLNGVSMFNPSAQTTGPSGPNLLAPTWEYNAASSAGKNLGYTFGEDLAGGHASTPNIYHYHDGTFLSAWLTGTGHSSGAWGITGLAETSVIKYLSSGLTHADGHSKILGISADGYPVYGPYGYVVATNNTSGIKRMGSGYTLNSAASREGTTASNTTLYPLGVFIEDYSFTASGDLDQHNGRYCVTPDYPNGTYAYFITLNSLLEPVYPYIIGNTYYGTPANLA
jgi:hypothetical protein